MGDFFQQIVDRDATGDEAAQLADRVVAWLVAQQIVQATPTKCVMSQDELGYAPGPRMEDWVDWPAGGESTRTLAVNGMEPITEKTVFWSATTDYEAHCPHGHTHVPPDGWLDVVDEWYSSTGPALVRCPTCDASFPLAEWSFAPGFAFGNLGFTFWNWPQFLSPRLIDEIGKLLAPHRVELVYSNL